MPDSNTHDRNDLTRRNFIALATTTTLSIAGFARSLEAHARPQMPTEFKGMVTAAQEFLNSLTPDLRNKALFPFDGKERTHWHFLPTSLTAMPEELRKRLHERKGLTLKEMTEPQRMAAHHLLRSALSTQGYLKALGIMHLEGVLRETEIKRGNDAGVTGLLRDPERYYFTVYGEPSIESPWGWRVEGHHLSLNFSSVTGNLVATTPAFMGANPAVIHTGTNAGMAILGAEEILARELLATMDTGQSSKVIIATKAPDDIVTGNSRKASLKGFAGIPALNMSGLQRELLMKLVQEYVNNMRQELAQALLDRIQSAGIEKIHFAWAGGTDRGVPHYYRIHGPTMLIEYDNTQDNANHIHSVCRDLENDFAEDMLGRHYKESGHHL